MAEGIVISIKGLPQLLKKLDGNTLAAEPLTQAMTASALEVERQARDNAPKWRNLLTGSITYDLIGKPIPLEARIGPAVGVTSEYAQVMEYGRKAGSKQPPIAAITPWANAHGIPPFVLARSIARKGIAGRHYMKKAAEGAVPFIRQAFDNAARKIEQRWGR